MKKSILIFAILFAFSTITFSQTGKELDNENGTSMMPVVGGLEDIVKTLEKEKVEIVRIEVDLLFTAKNTFRILYPKYTYGILTYGDYRFKSLALNIYKKENGEWKFFKTGENKDGTSSILITPEKLAEYKFEVIAAEFNEGYTGGHYVLIIMHN